MKPWAEYLAAQGYAVSVPRLPGHGTTLAGDEQDHLGRLVRRGRARLRGARQPGRHRRRLRAVDGRRPGAPARRRPPRPGRRPGARQPGRRHRAQGRQAAARCSSTSSRPCPGIANDIKKPGVEEYGYTKTPLRAADSMFQAYKAAARRPEPGDLPDPAVPLHRGPRRGPLERRVPSGRPCPRRTSARRCSRTATTWRRSTTTPQQIFEGSVAFVERVAGVAVRGPDRAVTTPRTTRRRRSAAAYPTTCPEASPPTRPPGARSSTTTATGPRSTTSPRSRSRPARHRAGAFPEEAAEDAGVAAPTPRSTSSRRRLRRCRCPSRRGCSRGWACSACRRFVLVALVAGLNLPTWLGLILMVWFVGGFVYLVATMRPGPATTTTTGRSLAAPHDHDREGST